MVVRMKNFNLWGVPRKIRLLWRVGGGSLKTNIEWGLSKKGAWTVCRFKEGLARKTTCVFEGV